MSSYSHILKALLNLISPGLKIPDLLINNIEEILLVRISNGNTLISNFDMSTLN